MNPSPPKWADQFLRWFCHPDLLEDLQGDLYEVYAYHIEQKAKWQAQLIFIWLVLRSFRLSALRKNQGLKNSNIMYFKNNLKIAARVLWRNKTNTSLNLLGLTLGIVCFVLLGTYVKQETSYDQFHEKKDRIYRTWLKEDYGEGQVFFNAVTPLRFESLFEENFPEVEKAVQYIESTTDVIVEQEKFSEKVCLISPDFFDVFDVKLIEGQLDNPLTDKSSVVISRSYAEKYFGYENPIGKDLIIRLDTDPEPMTVRGIFEDLPVQSSLQFDIAMSAELTKELYSEEAHRAWFSVIAETYLLLKDGSSAEELKDKISEVVLSQLGETTYAGEKIEKNQYFIGLQPLTAVHLDPSIPVGFASVTDPNFLTILGAIGIVVLVVAGVNYTTLSIGQSLQRSMEVGMRKVLGAGRINLMSQYLLESILISLSATLLGVAVAFFLLPVFNTLLDVQLHFDLSASGLLIFLALAILIGLIAGIYPALILSGFKVISSLKKDNRSTGKLTSRRILLTFQFAVVVILVSTAILMKKQVNYLMSKDLGHSKSSIISTELPGVQDAESMSELITLTMKRGSKLKSELLKDPRAIEIAMGTHVFGTEGWAEVAYTDDQKVFRKFRLLSVDENYLSTFEIKLEEGRSFEKGNTGDQRQAIIVNRAAVEFFKLEIPIGKKLPGKNFGAHKIIGVTENFHFSSLHHQMEPLVITQNPETIFQGITDGDIVDSIVPKLVMKYQNCDPLTAKSILKEAWDKVYPNENWNYKFVDEQIENQYINEARVDKIITLSTAIALLLASMGLLGMTLTVVNSKMKEISIKKILGASASSLFIHLSKGFTWQMLIAIGISIPVTIWFGQEWLANFAYSINVDASIFIGSILGTILVVVAVMSIHFMRAIRSNPANTLRSE